MCHGLSAMDTLRPPQAQRSTVRAAIVPRPFGHGYQMQDKQTKLLRCAAIVPRPFGHGYLRARIGLVLQFIGCNCATAFRPWILPSLSQAREPERSCNCATAFRPWIHPSRGMRTTEKRRCNCATAFRPWIPGSRAAGGPASGGCNCATAFRPWIQEGCG